MDIIVNMREPGEVIMIRNETNMPIVLKQSTPESKDIRINEGRTLFVIVGSVFKNIDEEDEVYYTFGSSLKSVARRAAKQISNGIPDYEEQLFNDMHDILIKHVVIINDLFSGLMIMTYQPVKPDTPRMMNNIDRIIHHSRIIMSRMACR